MLKINQNKKNGWKLGLKSCVCCQRQLELLNADYYFRDFLWSSVMSQLEEVIRFSYFWLQKNMPCGRLWQIAIDMLANILIISEHCFLKFIKNNNYDKYTPQAQKS